MTILDNDAAFQDADNFYAALIDAVDEAASEQAALKLLARLTIILANQIGSDSLLMAALDQARTPFPAVEVSP